MNQERTFYLQTILAEHMFLNVHLLGSLQAEIDAVNVVQHPKYLFYAIHTVTEEDNTLQILIQKIQQGWPKEKQKHNKVNNAQLNNQDKKYSRKTILSALTSGFTVCLHSSRHSAEGLQIAREFIYWRCMNDQINNQKGTLLTHELLERPCDKMGTDLFFYDNRGDLITVEYYSNLW